MTGAPVDARTAARLEVAGAAFLFLTLLVAGSAAMAVMGLDADSGSAEAVEKGMLGQLVGSLVALCAALVWRSRVSLRGDGRVLRPLLTYVAFLFVWVPVAIGVSAIWQALDLSMAPQPHLEYFAGERGGWQFVGAIALVCVVGPAVEEVVFRGHLQTGLTTLYGPRAALWWSAVLFGLVHVTSGTVLFVPITLLGLLFGWLRQRSGGLLAPIVAHVAHNTLMIVVVSSAPEILEQVQQR